MKQLIMNYQITDIPDPLYPQYQIAAGGDVLTAAGSDIEHLLRAVANMPPGSVSVALRFSFDPRRSRTNAQSRLTLYMLARARDGSTGEILRLLIERGALSRFYHFVRPRKVEVPWKRFTAICEILRREDAVEPLHQAEFNHRIPPFYYTIIPFEPNDRNDYLAVDRVLGDIREHVMIDLCIEPVDISPELAGHTRYLSKLQSINRAWDRDGEEDPGIHDYLGESPEWRSTWRHNSQLLQYQDPLADDILRSQQRFHETLRQPHLMFHIKTLSETPAVAALIASVVAESAFDGGSYRLLSYTREDGDFDEALRRVKEIRVSPESAHKTVFRGRDLSLYADMASLAHAATVNEIGGIFRLPVASSASPRCIRMNTDPPIENGRSFIIVGSDIQVPGELRVAETMSLPKHWLTTGVTGSAKSNFEINFILQLYRLGVPFLVIETAKTEYRVLKTLRNHPDEIARQLAESMEVYTPGNEAVSKFRLNPLQRRRGISIDEHIDNLISCFLAAMPVEGPLPALLGEGLERVYEKCPDEDYPPLMTDLVDATDEVLDEKGYSPETTSNLKSALEVRLGELTRRNMGKIFQCRYSYPDIDDLMKVPTVIELDRLVLEKACLTTLFLLNDVREHLRTVPRPGRVPRHVTLIEEAHNIVGTTAKAEASPDIADPKAFAADFLCRMLLEVRGLDEAVVIIDQHPSEVAPRVIKSTGSKLAFRQDHKDDRELLGSSMLFAPAEIEEMGRLKTGEAFFITEGYHKARRIQTENLHERFDLSADVFNENLLPHIQEDAWFQKATVGRSVSELTQFREQLDRFDEKRLKIVHEFTALFPRQQLAMARLTPRDKRRDLGELKREALDLKGRLSSAYTSFKRNSYRRYLLPLLSVTLHDPLVQEARDDLAHRFESVSARDTETTLEMIGDFIDRCSEQASIKGVHHGKA